MTRTGNVYVREEGAKEDVYIKASKTMHALHGDKVRYIVTGFAGRGTQCEGEVVSIVERSPYPFIGVLHTSGNQAWVLMQGKNMPYDVSVDVLDENNEPILHRKVLSGTPRREENTGYLRKRPDGWYDVTGIYDTVEGERSEFKVKRNVKVAVKVDGWARNEPYPYGHIVDVLGALGENETEMHAILAEYGLPYRFEPEVAKDAEKIPDAITPEDIKGRKDFRDTLTFTIDPADAKDFDDALSFKPLDNGNFEVGVHIADVSYYVKPGTLLDKEAQERGTSVYLVDRTVPMLPEKLSNRLCSLRPGEDKLTFSAVFEITPSGKVFNHWFGRTIINSDYRFAYETAQQIIDKGPAAMDEVLRGGTDGKGDMDEAAMGPGILEGCVIPGELKEAILKLWDLAAIFRKKRFENGAVSFERPEMKVLCDEKGKPISVFQRQSKEANWLIEEFMLLANRSVAEFIATGGKMNGSARKDAKTFVYRIHDVPNQEKLSSLGMFVRNFGYTLKFGEGRSVSKELNSLFDQCKGKPEFLPIELIALRAMSKACYSTDNIGHYGLAFDFYTHFTSPIRRYPDTMVHRLLAMYLDGAGSQNKDYYEQQCLHASDREVLAANAERDSIKYKTVEFMQDKIGQEFTGHISGLTEWGMYVEVEPTKIEGMVPLRTLRSDFYEFDEENYSLVGRHTRHTYRLGDEVKIKVGATSLEQRTLDYELVENLPAYERMPEYGYDDYYSLDDDEAELERAAQSYYHAPGNKKKKPSSSSGKRTTSTRKSSSSKGRKR